MPALLCLLGLTGCSEYFKKGIDRDGMGGGTSLGGIQGFVRLCSEWFRGSERIYPMADLAHSL